VAPRWRARVAALCLAALSGAVPRVFGAEAPAAAADPVLEARVQKLAAELRCLVCQNQTIADSNADLAVDLRRQVREMLQRGDSPEQVIAFMTQRYGDFVLYRPPVAGKTLVLWIGPGLLLVAGFVVLLAVLKRRSRLPPERFEPDPEEGA
jgi:cytochrome c-type biogenesis protein CcmH